MRTVTEVVVAWVLFLTSYTNALDIAIRRVSCDESLPVAIEYINMICSESQSSCTFGSVALLQGQLCYNGVYAIGLSQNSSAYMSGEFDVSVDYLSIPMGTQLDLCSDDWILAEDNANECPHDGLYNFEAIFQLPDYDDSWWATGWHESGELNLYADAHLEELIGSCEIYYDTQVTSTRAIHAPSAFTVVFLVSSIVLVGLTWALYYIMLVYRPRHRRRLEHVPRYDEDDDDGTHYYWNDHGKLSVDTEDDSVISRHTEAQSTGRWKFRILKRCGACDDDDENDDDTHPDIPHEVSYDSGLIERRSNDDGSVELTRIVSTSSAENSTLSGATTVASSESSSTLYSGSSSSSAVSILSSSRQEWEVYPDHQ